MENQSIKKAIFIGQAPPEKTNSIPFGRTRLYKWLDKIGYNKDFVISYFEFEALVDEFPGRSSKKHNIPKQKDIMNHIPFIIQKLDSDTIVIPIGKLSIEYILKLENIRLDDFIGKKFIAKSFGLTSFPNVIIPLPHPSGLSTWVFKDNNQALLDNALQLIKTEITRSINEN